MSTTSLKRAVSRFFTARKRELRTLSDTGIKGNDNFFELYVLARLAKTAQSTRFEQLRQVGSRRRFVVATSPSSKWAEVSYLKCRWSGPDYAVRTGLSVGVAKGRHTAEIDVVVIDLGAVPPAPGTPVSASAVVAGFECKAHDRPIQLPHANETIGKTARIWPTGVPARAGTPSYCVVTWAGAGTTAEEVLTDFGIAHARARVGAHDELGVHVRALSTTL